MSWNIFKRKDINIAKNATLNTFNIAYIDTMVILSQEDAYNIVEAISKIIIQNINNKKYEFEFDAITNKRKNRKEYVSKNVRIIISDD